MQGQQAHQVPLIPSISKSSLIVILAFLILKLHFSSVILRKKIILKTVVLPCTFPWYFDALWVSPGNAP